MDTLQEKFDNLSETDPIAVAKSITKVVVRYSVRATVALAVHTYIPVESKKQKLQLTIAVWALSGWVATEASYWASTRVAQTLELAQKMWNDRDQTLITEPTKLSAA